MKKTIILSLTIFLLSIGAASAQMNVFPNFAFGIKGGLNYSTFPSNGIYNNQNKAGYLGGFWARFGALGFNFQPELYLTGKNMTIKGESNGTEAEAKANFTSIDVPLLLGGKVGALGLGGRFYAGPVLSYIVNKDNSFTEVGQEAVGLKYKDANYAIQVGAGLDISSLSIDLRYEGGLNKLAYGDDNSHTRVSLFSLSLAYRLVSF